MTTKIVSKDELIKNLDRDLFERKRENVLNKVKTYKNEIDENNGIKIKIEYEFSVPKNKLKKFHEFLENNRDIQTLEDKIGIYIGENNINRSSYKEEDLKVPKSKNLGCEKCLKDWDHIDGKQECRPGWIFLAFSWVRCDCNEEEKCNNSIVEKEIKYEIKDVKPCSPKEYLTDRILDVLREYKLGEEGRGISKDIILNRLSCFNISKVKINGLLAELLYLNRIFISGLSIMMRFAGGSEDIIKNAKINAEKDKSYIWEFELHENDIVNITDEDTQFKDDLIYKNMRWKDLSSIETNKNDAFTNKENFFASTDKTKIWTLEDNIDHAILECLKQYEDEDRGISRYRLISETKFRQCEISRKDIDERLIYLAAKNLIVISGQYKNMRIAGGNKFICSRSIKKAKETYQPIYQFNYEDVINGLWKFEETEYDCYTGTFKKINNNLNNLKCQKCKKEITEKIENAGKCVSIICRDCCPGPNTSFNIDIESVGLT